MPLQTALEKVVGKEEQKVIGKQLRLPPLLEVTYMLKLISATNITENETKSPQSVASSK